MAEELVRSCDSVGKRSASRASGFRRPASSAGARAGSGSSTGSTVIVNGMTPPTPTSIKSNFLLPTMSPIPSSSSASGREHRERDRMTRSQSTAGIWDLPHPHTDPPKPAPLTRASTAFPAVGGPGSASSGSPAMPSVRPSTARPASRDSQSSLARMEANRESSSGLGAGSGKSRLPKARTGRLSEVAAAGRRRGERDSGVGATTTPSTTTTAAGEENQTPATPPLPRLQIARRRRDTSGELSGLSASAPGVGMGFLRRGSRVEE
jgi:hypothetical protein